MNTKNKILEASRLLFNEKGVMNITLRDIAKYLNKSYGNITYHFSNKEELILELMVEMNIELISLQEYTDQENLLVYILNLPIYNYSISMKYVFFSLDNLELKRNYTSLYKEIEKLNNMRRIKWMKILLKLKELKYFNEKISSNDIEYIMFLSYSVRLSYFQTQETKSYSFKSYTILVNNLLKPYLSRKGLNIYEDWYKSFINTNSNLIQLQ
jgi:hypothetical protein